MAKYEHLPIYKTAMDLAVYMENQVKNMGKYNKYAIGTELRKRTLSILSLVVRANSQQDKIPVLVELRIVLEELKQLLLLAKETKALGSFEMYRRNMEYAENLARQNEGWLKSMSKRKQ
jgi:hypothetical protein